MSKKNPVVFNVAVSENPDEAIGHSRIVNNVSSGIGISTLVEIIKNNIPVVEHEEVYTRREIIWTSRYECPCCNTSINALVRVTCSGLMVEGWREVEGYYLVTIDPEHGRCRVRIKRFVPEIIHEGWCELLPRKNYNANPEAKKEIEDRDNMINEFARKNPNRVLQVSGIETSDDLEKLVKAATKISKTQKGKKK